LGTTGLIASIGHGDVGDYSQKYGDMGKWGQEDLV